MILGEQYLRLPEEISYLHKFCNLWEMTFTGHLQGCPTVLGESSIQRDVTLNSLKALSGGVNLGGFKMTLIHTQSIWKTIMTFYPVSILSENTHQQIRLWGKRIGALDLS